jgi:Holliday junction resolvase RusA-like endonuclease
VIEFFVPGVAVPAGSKRAFPRAGRDGKLHVGVADASGPRGREWRAAIQLAASYALDGAPAPVPLGGALKLSLSFFLPRPKDHRGVRGLLPHAPRLPTTRPDLLKLARAVEDACTSILWRDDAQIVDEELHKTYADGEGARIGVLVGVTALAREGPPP